MNSISSYKDFYAIFQSSGIANGFPQPSSEPGDADKIILDTNPAKIISDIVIGWCHSNYSWWF